MIGIENYVIALIVSIGIFIILREFFCWYYKVNKRVALMEEQRDLLKQLLEKQNKSVKSAVTTDELMEEQRDLLNQLLKEQK